VALPYVAFVPEEDLHQSVKKWSARRAQRAWISTGSVSDLGLNLPSTHAQSISTMSRREFNTSGVPLAYLITIRSYGTWLHGDARGSIDRHNNSYGWPYAPRNHTLESHIKKTLAHEPILLDAKSREAIEMSITNTCTTLKWRLYAQNARTNHVHVVVSSLRHPDKVLLSLKAYATHYLRERGLWTKDGTPWAEKGSKRFLWTEDDVRWAVDYVLNRQGDPLT
jgi:REP element-mobilizing transposase RayT